MDHLDDCMGCIVCDGWVKSPSDLRKQSYIKYRKSDGTVVYPAEFRYCSYWGTWRRLLGIDANGWVWEIELTPINPQYADSWEKMGERIYHHCTPKGENDKEINYLPPEVLGRMGNELGVSRAYDLLHTPYLHLLDRVKYDRIQNGGADFKDCRR